jgi:hypothetical protein
MLRRRAELSVQPKLLELVDRLVALIDSFARAMLLRREHRMEVASFAEDLKVWLVYLVQEHQLQRPELRPEELRRAVDAARQYFETTYLPRLPWSGPGVETFFREVYEGAVAPPAEPGGPPARSLELAREIERFLNAATTALSKKRTFTVAEEAVLAWELADGVMAVIEKFRRDHPELAAAEIRRALSLVELDLGSA